MRLLQRTQCGAALVLMAASVGRAQEQSAATSDIFRRYADHVVKVQVVESGSGAKATIGSGFFVTADGHVVTNYHVISSVISSPSRYRAEVIDSTGAGHAVTVVAID